MESGGNVMERAHAVDGPPRPDARGASPHPQPSRVQSVPADEAGDRQEVDVIVVEDEQSVRESICEILRAAGITTCEACDGQAALERLERTHVGAMVLDVRMPRLDGLTMLRRLPGNAAPAILVSAYALEPGEREGLGTKVSGYLQKPFRPQALLEAVAAALGRAVR